MAIESEHPEMKEKNKGVLNEGDMMGYKKMTCQEIIATVTLMLRMDAE